MANGEPVSLRELISQWQAHHDMLHAVHDATHDREHKMADLAIRKSEEGMTLRLAGMNEIRQSMSDAAAKFATKEQMDARAESANARLYSLEKTNANLAGRMWAMGAVGGVGLVLVGIAVPVALFLIGRGP